MDNEILTTRRQKDTIDKFRIAVGKELGSEYPKIFIEDTEEGYIVHGYETKDSEPEEIVNVCDPSEMNRVFFLDCIFGPIGYFFKKIPDYRVKCFFDNGRFYEHYRDCE